MLGVLWAYEGWQFVTYCAGEVKDVQRTFPRALLVGTALIIGIYLLANIGYLAALAPAGVMSSNRVAATAVSNLINPSVSKLITITILISMFSAANGVTLTASRVFFAMARDRVFFQRLAEVHPRFQTPAFAVIAGGLWSTVLAITGPSSNYSLMLSSSAGFSTRWRLPASSCTGKGCPTRCDRIACQGIH
jgi:APA family basic amino acid/polyamine antiporter